MRRNAKECEEANPDRQTTRLGERSHEGRDGR